MKNSSDMENLLGEIESEDSKKDLKELLMKKLNAQQTKKLDELMHNEKALNELLGTPQAQELLKKLTGEKDGKH